VRHSDLFREFTDISVEVLFWDSLLKVSYYFQKKSNYERWDKGYPTFSLIVIFLEKGIFIPASARVLHTTNPYYSSFKHLKITHNSQRAN
jgi:hypothetical protein